MRKQPQMMLMRRKQKGPLNAKSPVAEIHDKRAGRSEVRPRFSNGEAIGSQSAIPQRLSAARREAMLKQIVRCQGNRSAQRFMNSDDLSSVRSAGYGPARRQGIGGAETPRAKTAPPLFQRSLAKEGRITVTGKSPGMIQRGFWGKVWGGVKKGAKWVGGGVKKGAKWVGGGVKKGAKWVAGAAKAVAGWAVKVIASLGRNAWEFIRALPKRLWRILVHGWNGITGMLKWLGTGLAGLAKAGWSALKGVFKWLGRGLSGALTWLKNGVVGGAKWAWDFIKSPSLEKLKDGLFAGLSWLGKGVKGLANWGWNGLVAAARWARDGIVGMAKWLWKGFLGGAEWTGRLIMHFLETLGLPEVLQFVWEVFNRLRPLNGAEIAASKQVHASGLIPYYLVRVDEKSLLTRINGMRAFVSFHIIHYPGTSVTPSTAVHELTHVAQYEKAGSVYMLEALHAQFTGGGYPYGNLVQARANGKRFSDFNREQQATICGDYYLVINGNAASEGGSRGDLQHYVDQMNRGEI